MSRSLGQDYALQAWVQAGAIPEDDLSHIVQAGAIRGAPDTTVLAAFQRWSESGNDHDYRTFYRVGFGFWVALDQHIAEATDGERTLDDVLEPLLDLVYSRDGLPPRRFLQILEEIGATGAGEVTPPSVGINAGLAGMIGAGVAIGVDSDAAGGLTMVVFGGACMGSGVAIDMGVIYIDSTAGGFATTAMFVDNVGPYQAAASGISFAPPAAAAPMAFAPGFTADYAIVFHNSNPAAVPALPPGAFLVQLTGGGPHVMTPLPVAQLPGPVPNPCGTFVIGGLTMAQLGARQGDAFRWIGTLLNSVNAFRSNETHGIGPATIPGGNPGNAGVGLAPGDFNSVPP